MEPEHGSSSIAKDGLFRLSYLHHRFIEGWLDIDEDRLVDFARLVRDLFIGGQTAVGVEQSATDEIGYGPFGAFENEMAELARTGKQLVELSAIAAGRLPFGRDLRVACGALVERGNVSPGREWLRDAELYVVRTSLPHEALSFLSGAFDGVLDPVIWAFEFDGRTLNHIANAV